MKKIFLILLFAFVCFNSVNVNAYTDEKPLVLIRFNKRVVLFEDKLKYAIKEALDANPNMKFEIISYYSKRGRKDMGRTPYEMAERKGRYVKDILVNEMDVPNYRIDFKVMSSNFGGNEIHIFVE